jgi:outer membrane biosynthesis protein TonB
VINRHTNEIKFCYEQQLIGHPDLQGRVSAKFIIAPTGAVQTAVISQSDLGNRAAEQCIAQAVARWIFPAPEGGGVVVVTYPFLLSQAGE